MTINQLMRIIHDSYPDSYTEMYWDEELCRLTNGTGDTLAQFLVSEIVDTFDPDAEDEEQLEEVIRILNKSISDLDGVRDAVNKSLYKLLD